LVILGDSISAGYGLENPDTDSYGAKLAVALDVPDSHYYNLAAAGMRSGDWVDAVEECCAGDFLAAHNIYVISVGSNDMLRAVLSGNKEAPAETAGDFAENLTRIVYALKTINPNARLYIQTIYNPFDDMPEADVSLAKAGVSLAEAEDIIAQMNAAIHEGSGADGYGYTVVDIYEAFKGKASLYTNIADFDTHPNEGRAYLNF
jgi:lysophospholipase L1-like esterase